MSTARRRADGVWCARFCKRCCRYFGAVEAAIAIPQAAPKSLFV